MAKSFKRLGQYIPRSTPMRNQSRRVPRGFYKWIARTLPKLRLSHQLIGFFVLVVLFPLLLLSLSIYSINQKAVKKQVRHFTEHTAAVTYEELRLEMAWQQEQALLAGEYWLSLLELPSESRKQARIEAFFKSYPNYESVAFYDAAGKQQALFHPSSAPAHRIVFSKTLNPLPKQVDFVLDYHKKAESTPDLTYSLQITVPGTLLEQQNNPSPGAIIFQKKFPYMGNIVRDRFKTFRNGFAFTDAEGTIIAGASTMVGRKIPSDDLHRFLSLKEGIVKEYSSTNPIAAIASKKQGTQDDAKLEKVIIKVPSLGWGLIIESPYNIQTKYIARARMQSVGLVFLCILLIVLLGMLYFQGINRNFRQLIKGIKALAEGRYSRKIRLITKSWTPYEIIYLAAEFNRMATKISTAWSSIQKLNQELVYKNQQDLFIAQATQRLHSSLELETVCETATQILCERPEILGALLYLNDEQNRHELAACKFQRPLASKEALFETFLNESLFQSALSTKKPLSALGNTSPLLPKEHFATIQPLIYQDTPLGVLVLIRRKRPLSSESAFDDGMILYLLSGQIGVAIHQARQWKQLQRANTQLAKLDEMKSNLIDTVSHELRTPLTSIKGYTSRLIRYENVLDSATKIKSLKVIKQQADRLGRLVEDLLVIPELERGEGIRVYPDRVNLHDLLMRSVSFIEEKANREIQVLQCPHELDILADPDRMEQVLLNLLDNATKYSLENTVVEVTAFRRSSLMAQIQVFNPCEPIPPEELAMLFTKFKRLDERLTRTTRGTGLGLFITRGLVEAMGGEIRIEQERGFRVILEMPLFLASSSRQADDAGLLPVIQ